MSEAEKYLISGIGAMEMRTKRPTLLHPFKRRRWNRKKRLLDYMAFRMSTYRDASKRDLLETMKSIRDRYNGDLIVPLPELPDV